MQAQGSADARILSKKNKVLEELIGPCSICGWKWTDAGLSWDPSSRHSLQHFTDFARTV